MKDPLINLIGKQKEERDFILSRPKVPRDKTNLLKELLKSSLIKVITGPRRAGKSTMAFQALSDSKFGYFNFEDDLLPSKIDSDLLIDTLMQCYDNPDVVFLDEIQHLDRWEQLANKLHRRGVNLILTGSNSKLLEGDLASSLTGRFAAIKVFPFSFLEFYKFKNGVEEEKRSLFQEFKDTSGYPDLILKGENPNLYIGTLFDSIILRDIVKKYRLRNVNLISTLYNRLAHSICSKLSYRQLEKDLENALSVNTIKKYLTYATEAYLFIELQPFYFKPRLRMKADRKLYAVDQGYVNFKSINVLGSEASLMENIVFVELMRRGFEPNKSLFYYQTKEGYEVDFLTVNDVGEIDLLQVSYSLESAKTRDRELRALLSAKAETRAKSCIVITLTSSEVLALKGEKIELVGISDWLLSLPSISLS